MTGAHLVMTESGAGVANETALQNPFPGLRPFEAAETHLFFGRDGQSSAIVERLAARRFVAVVGTSGSGKSSLVRAGLLPMLEGGFMARAGSAWRFAVMRPGSNAIRRLAEALADPDALGGESVTPELRTPLMEAVLRRSAIGLIDAFRQARLPEGENLLVVVDQFEELFRFHSTNVGGADTDNGAAFVNLLLEAVRQTELPIYVVLTMRSDFLGDCARFVDLPEMLNDGQYLIPRLTRDQRRASIEGPIAVSGASIAPRLTQRLLNDAGENPDVLPVLQHALMRTWDAWHMDGPANGPMDLEHYAHIGGMTEALSQHADQGYLALASIPGAQAAAQSLFRGLCERSADYRETRRPATFGNLCSVAGVDAATMTRVIDAFRRYGRTFLMPGWPTLLESDTMIDISHESLIRQWQTLRNWVQLESRSAALYTRLKTTAQLWPDNAALWRNPDLERALLWMNEERPNRAWAARYGTVEEFERAMSFLEASKTAWRAEVEREAALAQQKMDRELQELTQQDREGRLKAEVAALRSRKRFLNSLVILIPVLIAGLWWALQQQNRAEQQAALANRETRNAQLATRRTEQLLQRLTNSSRLKQAFLTGDAAAIQQLALTSPKDSTLEFESRQTPLGWKTGDGKPVYRFGLSPTAASLARTKQKVSQVSYYMNHPTFFVKLLSAGDGTKFQAWYNGWGCLSIVYVLVEYTNPDTPPSLSQFDQCASIKP